jgi:hypothetical protein
MRTFQVKLKTGELFKISADSFSAYSDHIHFFNLSPGKEVAIAYFHENDVKSVESMEEIGYSIGPRFVLYPELERLTESLESLSRRLVSVEDRTSEVNSKLFPIKAKKKKLGRPKAKAKK